jgi:hypothetical protein
MTEPLYLVIETRSVRFGDPESFPVLLTADKARAERGLNACWDKLQDLEYASKGIRFGSFEILELPPLDVLQPEYQKAEGEP